MADVSPPLSPAQRSKIRRLSEPREADAGEGGGELNLTPYLDIVMNVLMFVLATVAVTFASTIDTSAAGTNVVRREPGKLQLSAFITEQGVSLKTASGNVAPGCEGLGAGMTLPTRGGALDLASLSACARQIKAASPAFADETQVTVTASPGIDYASVVAVMDALRRDDRGELFPEVSLAVAR